MKTKKMNMKALLIAAIMIVSLVPVATAMKDKQTLLDVAVKVNSEGPYAGQFDTLIAAVLAADPAVAQALSGKGKLTVFAPTDAAFEKLGLNKDNIATLPQDKLTEILLYHVVNGNRDSKSVLSSKAFKTLQGEFFFQKQGVITDRNGNTANIIVTDVMASNGIIHAIDSVIMPKEKLKGHIIDVAVKVNSEGPYAGQFDTLIAAVLAADPVVAQKLSSRGQLTVFAPTDAAFEKLGLNKDNINTLPKEDLTKILLYHVAYGKRDAESVLSSTRIKTLRGQFLFQDEGVLTDQKGGKANIIVTDVMATNGVIHAIDNVLMPR
jgi:transforming growth factor-beta-induced protein